MSLQGPVSGHAECGRLHRRGALFRRPCILFFLVSTSFWPEPALAKCHKFSHWAYPFPQRCFTALAPLPIKHAAFAGQKTERIEPRPEQIDIVVPTVDFAPAPEGDEQLQGIAKLRALYDAR